MTPTESSSLVSNVLPLLNAYRDGELDSLNNVWRFSDTPGCDLSVDWRRKKQNDRDYLRHEDRGRFVVRNFEYLEGQPKRLDDAYSILIYTTNTNDLRLQVSDGRHFNIEKKEKTNIQMMAWRKVKNLSFADLVILMRSGKSLEIVSNDLPETKMVAPIQNRWFERSYKEFSKCAGIAYQDP